MTLDAASFFLSLGGAICGGVGAWVAVKVELAKLVVKVDHAARDADDAHKRLDNFLRLRAGSDSR